MWNQDLADLAQNYAEGCNFAHNNQRHGSFGYEFVGENLGAKSIESDGDYTFLVQAWYNEVNDYTYSTHTCEPGKQCGHYTQVRQIIDCVCVVYHVMCGNVLYTSHQIITGDIWSLSLSQLAERVQQAYIAAVRS